jgi:hypothetical protein
MHVHVKSPEGEAKIWMEPAIEVDRSVGYNQSEMSEIIEQVERHRDEIEGHWREHFS